MPLRFSWRQALLVPIMLQSLLVLGSVAPLSAEPLGLDKSGPRVPLSTSGRFIVDANGHRFKLKSVNWYGAHTEKQVSAGLDRQPIGTIIGLIKDWGFNSIRLPFSNQMLHDTQPVPAERLLGNPQWIGMTPLQVFDETVKALTDAGLLVILNNHSSLSEWCCNFDYNGLWYHMGSSLAYNQSLEMWQQDWLMLAQRYQSNKLVVGADLRNEVRTMRFQDTYLPVSPNWGSADKNDWHRAAQEMGQRLLDQNPDLLILVEGINWRGTIPLLGSGDRPHLKPVRDLPIKFTRPDKLVYAAHNYGFTGPKHNGDDKTSAGNKRYRDLDEASFVATVQDEWGFVVEPEQFYTAPLWVSEFGVAHDDPGPEERAWFKRLVDVLIERDADFAYWPLNDEGYGLVSEDWSTNRKDDWRFADLKRLLQADGVQGPVPSARYSQLAISKGDDNQSSVKIDWLNGGSKGTCPDGFSMRGLSRDHRALCSDSRSDLASEPGVDLQVEAVNETATRYHGGGDWAGGWTKYECPLNTYAAGFSKHSWGTSGLLCLPAARPLSSACRTLWFDRGDQRSSLKGGDWAKDSYKAQCADDEYLGGMAQRSGKAGALLCCLIQ